MRQMMLENGVTTSADLAFGGFGGVALEAPLFKSLYDLPTTPSRILAIPVAPVVTGDPNEWLAEMQAEYGSEKFFFSNRVKLFADGAFFAQYMQMNAPGYSDGHEGKWITEPDVLEAQAERFWQAGWTMHTHVNGDKGLDAVLDIFERLSAQNGQTMVLEHLGYSTEAQNQADRASWDDGFCSAKLYPSAGRCLCANRPWTGPCLADEPARLSGAQRCSAWAAQRFQHGAD